MRSIGRWLVLAVSLTLLWACSGDRDSPAAERCAHCGMLVETAPQWMSGTESQRFDTPKCLFRWSAEHGNDPIRGGWVTDYYGGEPLPIGEALFVVGSDVLGPMGDDLVPVTDAIKGELFVRDHGGRILPPAEIDATLLRSLDPQ